MNISTIVLDNIYKDFYEQNVTLSVLQGVTALFEQSRTYAITGVSGTGKSTLLQLIAGLDTPTSGQILYNALPCAAMSAREREQMLSKNLGLLFQDSYLIDCLTVIENVMLKGLVIREDPVLCKQRAQELLTLVGLAHKAAVYPRTLSGGQKQRVALVRALLNRPTFLLADEPTGNLDHETGKKIIQLLLELCAAWGMGLIISSHEPYVLQQMQTVFELKDGILTKKYDV